MFKYPSINPKGRLRRIFIMVVFFILAFATHQLLSNYKQQILSAVFLLIVFSGVLFYEYKSLFTKNQQTIEYFITIFFIVFFTVLLFATIYDQEIEDSGNYFIENGKITDLTFPDAIYFSVTTLTTVGYGDIVPVGIFRVFAVIEIFMGLIYIGTMVNILTKHMNKQ
jgi:potassium channel LctB